MSNAPFIGIDLGTSKICVSVYQNGKAEIIQDEINNRTTPSYISFTDTKKLFGDSAKNQMNRNPMNTLFNIKRLIGRKYEDKYIQDHMKYFPFEIVKELSSGFVQLQITLKNGKRKYLVEEILALEF